MSLEIVVTTSRWKNDPSSRMLVDYLNANSSVLGLDGSVVYYDFPVYADYEANLFRPDVLILSPAHGFIVIRVIDISASSKKMDGIKSIDAALGDFSSNLYSRIIRSRELRKSRTTSIVEIHPVILCNYSTSPLNTISQNLEGIDAQVCSSLESLCEFMNKVSQPVLSETIIAEVRSVVEGAKALTRTSKRVIDDPSKSPLAVALAKIENEIANFDEKQRHIALVDVGGPARIRGLAGSGKTVILAMKAAHIHLNEPDSVILITFFTKSLRATIKTLVTKFFRLYSDSDPDWRKVQIRHGWGGRSVPGVYSDACARSGRTTLTLQDAQRIAGRGETALGAACADLLNNVALQPFYDHVLIDEGQDFPVNFYKLAFHIARGERDKKNIVWAYDELQDIMNVRIRQPDELFGLGQDGVPLVDLDRTSSQLPPGATNDAVLSKTYRNQRNVLVTAHALGFGVYGGIVQMLESKEHWEDVGYHVNTGALVQGNKVEISRPDRNSPLAIPANDSTPIIDSYQALSFEEEIDWTVNNIKIFIAGGLEPEEILVISLDDRNARYYLTTLSEKLALAGLSSNNVIADPYNEPPFIIAGKITLSTVYRAKGNEAAAVIAIGIDAVDIRVRDGRNKIFTAFTRSKAWLRVSGTGNEAKKILAELKTAVAKAPDMTFTMPDLKLINTIQRGFSKKQSAVRAAREQYLQRLRAAGLSDQEIDEEITQGLAGE